MKALIVVNLDGNTTYSDVDEMRRKWESLVASNFNSPLAILGGKAEVFYLPDNYLEANVFTPAEVELLLEKIKSASAVIGVQDARPEAE